jgi:hypothetical protein
VLTYLG